MVLHNIFLRVSYLLLLLTLILLVSGCASLKSEDDNLLSRAFKSKSSTSIGKSTGAASQPVNKVDHLVRKESCKELFLRNGYDVTKNREGDQGFQQAYQTCLNDTNKPYPTDTFSIALSGGGTRAASYAMGVLKALNEGGYLKQADAISSVSGGGYTSMWYFNHLYYQYLPKKYLDPKSEEFLGEVYALGYYDELLGDEQQLAEFCDRVERQEALYPLNGIFSTREESSVVDTTTAQTHVEQQSDIINYSRSPFVQRLESLGLVVSQIASLPPYWVTDVLLNTRIFKGSPASHAYRKGLERTYGLVGNPEFNSYTDYFEYKPEQYLNGVHGTIMFWRDNAGTQNLKMKHYRDFMTAYNSCASGSSQVTPISLPIINTKLTPRATFIKDNEFDEKSLTKSVYSFTPLAYGSEYIGYFDDEELDSPTYISKLYAISGAAADNGAREVSGFLDPVVKFLNVNLGMVVRNPNTQDSFAGTARFYIDKLVGGFPLGYLVPEEYKTTLRLSDGGHAENLGLFSLIKRGTKRIVVVDAEYDSQYDFDALNRLKVKLKEELSLELVCIESAPCPMVSDFRNDRANPVFEMAVKGFDHGIEEDIKILYIKLSANVNHVKERCDERKPYPSELEAECNKNNAYPKHVRDYYLSEVDKEKAKFPHNSTADIWYSEEQYRAYRDLGYFNAKTYLLEQMEERGWRSHIEQSRVHENSYFKGLFN